MMAPENRRIAFFSAALLVLVVSYLLLGGAWLPWDLRPGSPWGQSLAIAAAVILLASGSYLPMRRSAAPTFDRPRLQFWHTLAGSLGAALAVIHSRLALDQWSTLLLLTVIALWLTGLYGRVVSPLRVGEAFGRGALPYQALTADGPYSAKLKELMAAKGRVVAAFAPDMSEGQFVLRTYHWLRHPRDAFRYHRLARAERALLASQPLSGTTQISVAERGWRRLHLALAALFVVGLIAHVITTVFFAGYVAEGREIYWWHATAWGG